MITKLIIKNFKRLVETKIPLENREMVADHQNE